MEMPAVSKRMKLTGTLGLAGAGTVLVLSIFGWMQFRDTPYTSSALTLDDQTLEAKALGWAQEHGLQGTPWAKRAVRMTRGELLALEGSGGSGEASDTGFGPDAPVFVLAIRGKVQWAAPGYIPQDPGSEPKVDNNLDNITVAVDTRNGNGMWASANRATSSMPIQVPLNDLTPVVPITFVPTRAPIRAPTLAPTRPANAPAHAPRALPTTALSAPALNPYP